MFSEGGPRPYDQNEIGTPTTPADLEKAKANFSPDAPENPVITRQREQEVREKAKRDRRNSAILTAAGLAAAAAITFGPREATSADTSLPDNRFTPERTAAMPEATPITSMQAAEKALADARAAEEASKTLVAELNQPEEVPATVLNQDFAGLQTQRLE